MLSVLIYSLMCYGMASAIVYYSGPFDIFIKWREIIAYHDKLLELFSCMFCLPTNIGIVLSLLNVAICPNVPFTPFALLFNGNYSFWPIIIIFDGFYTGAVVSIIDTIINRIDVNSVNNDEKRLLND